MTQLFKVILIETRNTCTRRCWFCKFGQDRQDDAIVEMSWQTIERLVYNLKGLNYSGRISWFWINEPLLEKRIFEILKLTKRHCPGAFLSLVTNGDLLNEALYYRLRECGLAALGVSIYDDKIFAKVDRMKKNERLVMIDMRNPPAGTLNNRADNIKQNPHVFAKDRRKFLTKACGLPFSLITVNPKGQVVLCCSDMYSDVVMGDIREQRLEEIWNSERFNHYRATLVTQGREGLQLCDGCSWDGAPLSSYYPLRPKSGYIKTTIRRVGGFLGLG